MDHATSYQHCTQADEPEAAIPQASELEMVRYYATEIGVLIGGMEQAQVERARAGLEPNPMLPHYMRTLKRIRAGIDRECDGLDGVLAERDAE